jgi:uncharacterized protein with NRDE domain
MCTVIFIPDNEKVFFASLRDESPMRERAIAPSIVKINKVKTLSPKDPVAGGTWIGTNNAANVIILLNGAFENHLRNDYYRKSRGIIVSELLATALPVTEWNKIDMKNIEPFTLVVWSKRNLYQLVWDGNTKHTFLLDAAQSHIWSSATLYNASAGIIRKEAFQKWIAEKPSVCKLSILNFFTSSFIDPQNGFIMNRNEKIKTLSYTFVEMKNDTSLMNYRDFLTGAETAQSISFIGLAANLIH